MPSVDYVAIRKAIALTVEEALGMTCILDEQKGQLGIAENRPPLPYASFKILTPGTQVGDDDRRYIGDNATEEDAATELKFNIGGNRKMTVSFKVYDEIQECAYGHMATLQSALQGWKAQEKLRLAGIAIWTIGAVADLSQLLNTGYEARANMDVEFGIAANFEESVPLVDKIELEGTVTGLLNPEVVTFTVPDQEDE